MDLKSHRSSGGLDFSLTSVNIVFLLLLFFLSAGTLLQEAEKNVEAPRTSTMPLDRLPRPLLIINPSGELYLDGEKTTVEGLAEQATAAQIETENPASAGTPVLHVLADRALDARQALQIVKDIRTQGRWNITLVTIRE